MDFLTFPANFRLLQLWLSVQLCYYTYAQLSIKKKIFDIMRTILYNIFTAVNRETPVSTAIFWRFCTRLRRQRGSCVFLEAVVECQKKKKEMRT